MKPEVHIAAGKSVDEALTAFRQGVNQPGTMFSTDRWLLPKLDRLRKLLTDPITQDETEALLDVLYQRHWMSDLIEWLETRPTGWAGSFAYRENRAKEEPRKRAAAGLDPYVDDKLLPDDFHPKISETCPDCGSPNWKSIAYGLPTEDTLEDARRGHFVLGGCTLQDARRFCSACLNRWPTKPDMNPPNGRPEWIKQQIVKTRSEFARLSALASLPPDPEEPRVERAWARIDGSVRFLVSSGTEKGRVEKTLEYARLGGAPRYSWGQWHISDDSQKNHDLNAIAAIRFERTHLPEKHNLYNNWDIVQAHWRKRGRAWDEESYHRERVKKNLKNLSRLLRLARSVAEKLPRVINVPSSKYPKIFRVQFSWGIIRVEANAAFPFELPEYSCRELCGGGRGSRTGPRSCLCRGHAFRISQVSPIRNRTQQPPTRLGMTSSHLIRPCSAHWLSAWCRTVGA